MATYSKTQGSELLAVTSCATATITKSSILTVTTALSATIFVRIGRIAANALTNPAIVRIQASSQSGAVASGDNHWFDYAIFATGTAAAATLDTLKASGNDAGTATLTKSTAFNIAIGDYIFINNGTIANSEFARTIAKAGAGDPYTISLVDNLSNAQNSSVVSNQAENFMAQIDCSNIGRIRVLIDCLGANAATGYSVAAQVTAITGDSIA
jgi:hypothetical protein